ncbi:MAG TPA: DUF2127 domain-containing protein, partial [Acidimicrobiales bacterium]
HAETVVCGVRGHVVPAAGTHEVAPDWAHLVTTTVDGRRLGRCLRCDAWLPAPLGPAVLEELSPERVPRRDQALRDAIVLRLIAVERAVHSVVFGLAAIGLVFLRLDLRGLQSQARYLTRNGSGGLAGPGQTASQSTIVRELDRLLNLRRGTLGVLALTAAVYCVVEGVEAVGLWMERRWAEYLTALATAGFLPFEINELAKRLTVVRVGALVVNVVVLVYLVWRKHLFGIGGRPPEEDRVAALRLEPAAGEGRADQGNATAS